MRTEAMINQAMSFNNLDRNSHRRWLDLLSLEWTGRLPYVRVLKGPYSLRDGS